MLARLDAIMTRQLDAAQNTNGAFSLGPALAGLRE